MAETLSKVTFALLGVEKLPGYESRVRNQTRRARRFGSDRGN